MSDKVFGINADIFKEYGASKDVYESFLKSEIYETGDRERSMEKVVEDLEAIALVVKETGVTRNELANHPFFTETQAAAIWNYCDGALAVALIKPTKKAAMDYIREGDQFLRCMVAALDGRVHLKDSLAAFDAMRAMAEEMGASENQAGAPRP